MTGTLNCGTMGSQMYPGYLNKDHNWHITGQFRNGGDNWSAQKKLFLLHDYIA